MVLVVHRRDTTVHILEEAHAFLISSYLAPGPLSQRQWLPASLPLSLSSFDVAGNVCLLKLTGKVGNRGWFQIRRQQKTKHSSFHSSSMRSQVIWCQPWLNIIFFLGGGRLRMIGSD
jgi:hypothetical protein